MRETTDSYIWELEILATTKLGILSQTYAAGKASDRVIDAGLRI